MRLLPAPESAVVYSRGSGRVNRGADAGNHRGDFIRISPANFPLLNHFALPEPPRGDSSPSFHSGCGARFSENLPPAVLVPQLFIPSLSSRTLDSLGGEGSAFHPVHLLLSGFRLSIFDFRFPPPVSSTLLPESLRFLRILRLAFIPRLPAAGGAEGRTFSKTHRPDSRGGHRAVGPALLPVAHSLWPRLTILRFLRILRTFIFASALLGSKPRSPNP